jgi:hypothetical protein
MTVSETNLRKEANVIQTQIDNVNATITSQRRVIELNDSYSKKMSAYTRLVLAIVFALAIAVLLNMLKSKFAIIPGAVITIAYIILFSASIFYAMYVLADIDSREKTDFDKLDLGPPDGVSKSIQKIKPYDSSLDLLPGFCIGKDCCTSGMAWDNDENKCLTSCPEAGYYIDDTSQECTKCAAGTYVGASTPTASSCTNCAAGTYSGEGAESCIACAAGTYSGLGSSSCINCPAGKSSNASSTSEASCTNCPIGKYSAAGGLCTDCPEGQYSATPGAVSCTACPSGYTNKSLGLTSLAACTAV